MATIDGTDGDDNLIGTSGDDTINGLGGNDTIYGDAGNDTINGGDGDDIIDGGAGNDKLSGGTGVNFVSYAHASNGVSVDLAITGAQFVSNGSGTDTLSGFQGIIGTNFSDTLKGDDNDNTLIAGGGIDTLIGRGGNDVLYVGTADDYSPNGEGYDGGIGYDTLQISGDIDLNLASISNVEKLLAPGFAISLRADQLDGFTDVDAKSITVQTFGTVDLSLGMVSVGEFHFDSEEVTLNLSGSTGGGHIFYGTTGMDFFTGGLGNDTMYGSGGADILNGDGGDDVIEGGAGNDTMDGGTGTDTVSFASDNQGAYVSLVAHNANGSGIENDTITNFENIIGTGGDDTLIGDGGNNVLAGRAGNDTLVGGGGIDTADYSDETSAVSVNLATGTATGTGIGNDMLSTIENVTGGSGNDSLTGDGGDNVLLGGDGNDTLDGGAGNDVLDGGTGTNTATYASDASGVSVLLQLGIASGTGIGTDTLLNIQNVTSGSGADILTGNDSGNTLNGGNGNDTLSGGRGNDTLIGGSGIDTADYSTDTAGVTANLTTGTATGSNAGLDTLSGIENLIGGFGNDALTGDGNANVLIGKQGNDTLDGGGGNDTVSYDGAVQSVLVDLAAGTANGTEIGHDTLISIETVIGGSGDDTLKGDGNTNVLQGGAGNDTLIGGGGNDTLNGGADTDTASFTGDSAGVTANLASGTATGSAIGTDTLIGIENLTGGTGNDTLTGDAGSNTLTGGNGDDTLDGGAGSDTLDGGIGIDTVSYANDGAGVSVDLGSGTATTASGNDTLLAIENVTGGAGSDTLSGSSANNVLAGGASGDTIDISQGGNDTANGETGDDTILAGAALTAADKIDGGIGNEILRLNGDYSAGVSFGAATMVNVETLAFAAGHNYVLTGNNGNVAAGGVLTVDASALAAANGASFDGSAEGDGSFVFVGGAGNDTFLGSANNDTFSLAKAGNDTVSGRSGNDTFNFFATFSAGDAVDGGLGTDVLNLAGNYAGGVTMTATTLLNMEKIVFADGFSYKLTSHNATVGAGKLLTLDGSALGAASALTFDGSAETDGSFSFLAGLGNDVLTGGSGADTFDLRSGGKDKAVGGGGADTFLLGATLASTDTIDGGAGSDILIVDGDYSAGLALSGVTNVETLKLTAGHSYAITAPDSAVAAGMTMTIDGSKLGVGDVLTFKGSAELDGNYAILAGAAADTITTGAGNDSVDAGGGDDFLDLRAGGIDTLTGGSGNDTFRFGATLTQQDKVDGGSGNDLVTLEGDYSAGVVFNATTLVNVETLRLVGGHSYQLTLNDTTVAAGKTITIDGGDLGSADHLILDGSKELDGSLTLNGGAGGDTLTGGAQGDKLRGGMGADVQNGKAGADVFQYKAAAESTGAGYDTIVGMDFSSDHIAVKSNVSGVDATIAGAALSTAHFDSDLAAAADAAHLLRHHAAFVKVASGDLAGDIFLVIDQNGTAGYQAGADIVILMQNAQNMSGIDVSDFR